MKRTIDPLDQIATLHTPEGLVVYELILDPSVQSVVSGNQLIVSARPVDPPPSSEPPYQAPTDRDPRPLPPLRTETLSPRMELIRLHIIRVGIELRIKL